MLAVLYVATQLEIRDVLMRKLIAALGVTTIGLICVMAPARSEPVTPAAGAKISHVPKGRFSPVVRHGRPVLAPLSPPGPAKASDPRYQQMWDPCQVEG
jgi:hypothetical protein